MKESVESIVLSPNQTLAKLAECIENAGKPVVVVSDLDDTLSNSYRFDEKLQTHIPFIRAETVDAAQQLKNPILIATGRPIHDLVVPMAWRRLSRPPMPIIAENGGIIFRPDQNTFIETHPSSIEDNPLNSLGVDLESHIEQLRERGIINATMEANTDRTRKTSIELRIQDKLTKVGSPLVHKEVADFLHPLMIDHHLIAISSGSSVSIHVPEISKGDSVLRVLESLRNDIFLVALGDNKNDTSLFEISDFGIGVGQDTIGLCDVTCLGGEAVSLAVLQKINELTI